ncbi:MAG TPA: substrate-binding domain-containing protein [Solirubrobacteraceae bacterium]|nr:substrate-binding domain-containing protein [Solirubrobacteraceae bacterium]
MSENRTPSGGGRRKRKNDLPVEVPEAQRELSRRRFLKYAGASAVAIPAYAGMVDVLTAEPASAATYKANAHIAAFAHHPKYHFVMDCHVTTNSFFTATVYGIQDACALAGCSYQWTGSTNSIVGQMVSAMNSAIASKANGIGVCLIDNTAFNNPVASALSHGIPVIAFNADVSAGVKNNRMAYVGQNNLTAGAAVAKEILKLGIGKGDLVAGIIATPGTGNIQPRLDGAKPVLKKAGVHLQEVGTSATEGAPEYNKISAWYAGHKDVKFMMAVDSGDSNAVAQFIQKEHLKGKVKASVWDVGLPVTQAIHAGYITTTVDQQAYLQGFDTIMQLFLWNVSGGLMVPTDTDTGLGIVTKSNVGPYLNKNRFEGTSAGAKTLKAPGKIA